MNPFLLVILLLIVVYKLYSFVTGTPPNAPPGILRLPIVGSYWFLLWGNYKFPHKTVPYYVKKLKSSIISYYLGNSYTVIVNDYKLIKEVFTREDYDGRVTDLNIAKARAFGKTLGIFFTDGSQWQEQRRFALRHMRDFGFGRRQEKLEIEIMDELQLLINMLKNGPINSDEETVLKHDGAVLIPEIFYAFYVNSIWYVMFGKRFDRAEHDKLRNFARSAILFQRSSDTTGGAIAAVPFLEHFGDMFAFKSILKGNYEMIDFIKKYLEEQIRSCSDNDDRGLTDRYIKKLKEINGASTFTEEQLIMTLLDFMFPAISALPSTIAHCIKYVMHNSHVITKMCEEIDNIVGKERLVTWEDRKNLPYTEATVREAFRIETLTPFGVFHRSVKKTTLGGYSIPANTIVITNLANMNEDPDVWGDPQNFRPERFLNVDGQLNKDLTFPFGFGHRVCAGETFARYTLFGTFAALIQNFNFSFIEGEPIGLDDKLPGLIVTPKEAWIRVKPRH